MTSCGDDNCVHCDVDGDGKCPNKPLFAGLGFPNRPLAPAKDARFDDSELAIKTEFVKVPGIGHGCWRAYDPVTRLGTYGGTKERAIEDLKAKIAARAVHEQGEG